MGGSRCADSRQDADGSLVYRQYAGRTFRRYHDRWLKPVVEGREYRAVQQRQLSEWMAIQFESRLSVAYPSGDGRWPDRRHVGTESRLVGLCLRSRLC